MWFGEQVPNADAVALSCEGSACSGELEEVVGRAEHCPLAANFVEAAEKELTKAPRLWIGVEQGLCRTFRAGGALM